ALSTDRLVRHAESRSRDRPSLLRFRARSRSALVEVVHNESGESSSRPNRRILGAVSITTGAFGTNENFFGRCAMYWRIRRRLDLWTGLMLAAPAGSRRTRRQVAGGTKKTPPKSAALLGSDCDLALGCQIQVLHVEVDGADLRAQVVGGQDTHREPMPRVAELRCVHRESPAAVQAVREEWICLL